MATRPNYQTVWGATAPTNGPFGAPETLGYWFTLAVPKRLYGFRWYSDGRHPDFALFQLWDQTLKIVCEHVLTALENAFVPAGPGWRNAWAHPTAQLAAGTPYLLSGNVVQFGYNPGALLAAPVVVGDVTVLQNGTSPQPANGVYDSTTDSTGRYAFVNPPDTPTAGNFYSLDMLLLDHA